MEEVPYIRLAKVEYSAKAIICFFDEALDFLLSQETIQVDMSFKRVDGGWKEVTFSGWVDEGEIRRCYFINVY
jgi:hypothetical protein